MYFTSPARQTSIPVPSPTSPLSTNESEDDSNRENENPIDSVDDQLYTVSRSTTNQRHDVWCCTWIDLSDNGLLTQFQFII